MDKKLQNPTKKKSDDTVLVLAPAPEEYDVEEDNEDTDEAGTSTEGATPFQFIDDMPVIEIEDEKQPPHSTGLPSQTNKRRSLLLKIALVVAVLIVTSGFLWFTVFAPPAQPLTTPTVASATPSHHPQQVPIPTSGPVPTAGSSGTWVPEPLPAGWMSAGLTMGDAIEASRMAWAFTDSEEGIDFRNVGTEAEHGGTLTAATFLLTSGGKARFFQSDVRVTTNVLFDKVTTNQIIQAAVNPVPSLTAFAVQGGNQFAWADVSYELFQSQPDLNNPGQRIEGLEMDPTTNQPLIYHMSVLLVRVAPDMQSTDAPMGGTGWLVSNYGLDLQVPLAIAQPI